jgi:hypothetical protein
MKRLSAWLVVLLLLSPFACSDNPVDQGTGGKPITADSIASFWMGALRDSVVALGDKEEAELRDVRFDAIRNGFNRALARDSDNPAAHLGLAILELLELNYSTEIWQLVDDIEDWSEGGSSSGPVDRNRMLIGRQFELMVELPFNFYGRLATSVSGDVSIARIQNVIKNLVMPAVGRSINHLATTEEHTDTEVRIKVDDDPVEYVRIDLGEIYVFDAAMHALRSCFGSLIAYDVDLFGPDGTYDWVNDVRDLQGETDYSWCADNYTVTPSSPYDILDIYINGDASAYVDSILLAVLHHNVTTRPEYLELRDGGGPLQGAHADLNGVISKLEAAVDFIRDVRTGETEENVIKLTDLTDLDSDISEPGNKPNFAENWTRIEDVLEFARDLLNGPVQFNEELGPNDTPFQWTLDLEALYLPGVLDWKTLFPYHRWNLPSGPWVVCQSSAYSWDNGGYEFYLDVWQDGYCDFVTIPNIGLVREWRESCDLPFDTYVQLLDGPGGNPIDLGVEKFPYFPDYTFNGIFPDMGTHARWVELVNILGGDAAALSVRAQ